MCSPRVEVAVDLHQLLPHHPRCDALRRVDRLGARFAAAEHEKVSDGFGAGSAPMRPDGRRTAPRRIRVAAHLTAGGGVAGVEGVVAGEDSDDPARAGRAQRLQDEVVVQGVPVGIVDRVMQHEVREGDVADRGVEEPVRDLRVREGLRVDRRVRVQQLGDPCGRLVELNARELIARRGESDERAAARSGLEHSTGLQPETCHRVPHGVDVAGSV
jgi:hypothetical protein